MNWVEQYLLEYEAPEDGVPCQGNYCEGITVDVRIVFDPYAYGMFSQKIETVLCPTCYACRSQDV